MVERRLPSLSHPVARISTQLEAQIVVSQDLGFLAVEAALGLNEKTTEIARMLNGIIRYLDRR